jgi:hypothetical protein
MCTVLLPPGVNPIAGNKYIIIISSYKINSHWTDFKEISFLRIFQKSVEKVQVLLKYDKNNEDFT